MNEREKGSKSKSECNIRIYIYISADTKVNLFNRIKVSENKSEIEMKVMNVPCVYD